MSRGASTDPSWPLAGSVKKIEAGHGSHGFLASTASAADDLVYYFYTTNSFEF